MNCCNRMKVSGGTVRPASGIVEAAVAILQRSRNKFDVLVPVPPSGSRPVQPVLILAHGIGKALDLPVADCVSATRPATQLKGVMDPDKRRELLEGLYTVERVQTRGKSVLLFDDLYPFRRYDERHYGVAHDGGKGRGCARADDYENTEHTVSVVFVGGSRRVTRLPEQAKTRIDKAVDRGFAILVGDANGADKAVQKHLAEAQYDKVTVYCSGDRSRNNVGQWETRNVSTGERERDFQVLRCQGS